MKKFSERIGIVSQPGTIQMDGMSDPLRNSLWNLLLRFYDYKQLRTLLIFLTEHYFKKPTDEVPYRGFDCKELLKKSFFGMQWYEVYDLVEFIVKKFRFTKNHATEAEKQRFIANCNFILERELSGYRFISEILTPISSEEEVVEISEAIERSSVNNLFGAREHLKTALSLLGKKPQPDYRNSIKESISAVESIVKQITGSQSSGLSHALNKLSEHSEIHGALKSAFNKLYGYTSDEDGIRHAILDAPNIGFDEAKFMVVSCSAFVNFLISKAENAGLLK